MSDSCDISDSPNKITQHPKFLAIANQIESITPPELSEFEPMIYSESYVARNNKQTGQFSSSKIRDLEDNMMNVPIIGRVKSEVYLLDNQQKSPLTQLKTFQDKQSGEKSSRKIIQLRTIYQWQGQQHQYLQASNLDSNDGISLRKAQGIASSKYLVGVDQIILEPIVKKQGRISIEYQEPNKTNSRGLQTIWRHRALRIVHFISKFIQQLKTKTEKIKYRLLTNKVFDIIGDRTSDFQTILLSRQNNVKPKLKQRVERQIKIFVRIIQRNYEIVENFLGRNVKVLQPDDNFKIAWDIVVVVFIILNLFYIPLKISFNLNKYETHTSQLFLETFPSYIFILEIIKSFNTAYYDKGIIHIDRRQIFKHYVSSNFIWDIIVVVPFIISQFNVPYTDFTLLLRITRIRSMVQQLEDVLNMEDKVQAVFELFKLVYLLTFVVHFCACAWHFLAIVEVEYWGSTESWLIVQQLEAKSQTKQYIASIYWSTITILTVGYGDITPITDYERVFVIFVSLIICGVFGYAISRISEILKRIEDQNATYRMRMKMINQHIQKRNLGKALQLKVRKYFEYYFKLEQNDNSQAEELMSHLTKHLKEEVLIDIYYKTLKNSRLLGQNLSQSLLEKLCIHVKEKKFAPEEEIFSRGEQANQLIFVQSGEIQIYVQQVTNGSDESIETLLRTFKSGYCVGEREFATNKSYEYNARATSFTQIALLDFADLQNILKDHYEDFEKFCLIRDNLIFNQNYKNLGKVCEICQSTHGFLKCPFVFFQANQAKIANKFRSSKVSKRMWYQRDKHKSNIKGCLIDIQEAALGFIISNQIIPEIQLTDSYLAELGFKLNDDEQNQPQNNTSPSILMLKSTKAVLQKRESQKYSNTPNNRNDTKINAEKIFFPKDYQMRRIDAKIENLKLNWENEISPFKQPPTGSPESPLKIKNQLDFSMIDEVEEEQLALKIQQSINLKQGQQKLAKKRKNKGDLLDSMRAIKLIGVSSFKDAKKRDSITSKQSIVKNQIVKSFNQQQSKLSVESGIYDRPNDLKMTGPQQSMQFLESKLMFDYDDMSQHRPNQSQKKRKPSLLSSIVENNFNELPLIQLGPSNRKVSGGSLLSHEEKDKDINMRGSKQMKVKDSITFFSEIDDNPDVIAEIKEILHQHTDFEIDTKQSSNIYFPLFNIEIVMQKLLQNYESKIEAIKLQDGSLLKKSRASNNPFDRIQTQKYK